MIRVESIEVRGHSDAGPFHGRLTFSEGLQVISGANGFGKTLSGKALAWALGLEPLFGRKESDPGFLPLALTEEINFPGKPSAKVKTSEATVVLVRDDGERLTLTRAITHDQNRIRILRQHDGAEERLTLMTGAGSMADETIGFQRFLFDWLGWPITRTTTFEGREAYLYLENLAPLFYVEQSEGWSEIQAHQIGRYAQQQIKEIAVEYLLGGLDAVTARVGKQRTATLDTGLRTSAKAIAARALAVFLRQGWSIDWSGNGSVKEIEARWTKTTLRAALRRDADIDITAQRKLLEDKIAALRTALTQSPIDASNVSAHSSSSQLVVDLKQQLHRRNMELHTLRVQYADNGRLLESLDHRIRTATDVLRLKQTGVGRLSQLECPTCHQHLDSIAFDLTAHTAADVGAHIEALKRDRSLTHQTVEALAETIRRSDADTRELETKFRNAQHVLEDVTTTVGAVREQLVRTAGALTAEERLLERLATAAQDIDAVQADADRWLKDAAAARAEIHSPGDIDRRVAAFRNALAIYLSALGHTGAIAQGIQGLRVDALQYEPFIGERRVRTLGAGSDPARLVAAYTLAMASASAALKDGLHPGVVILDEPMQQNPDGLHRRLLIDFLGQTVAKQSGVQVIILTSLEDDEVAALRAAGTTVKTVDGHFLQLEEPPKGEPATPVPSTEKLTSTASAMTDETTAEPTRPETETPTATTEAPGKGADPTGDLEAEPPS